MPRRKKHRRCIKTNTSNENQPADSQPLYTNQQIGSALQQIMHVQHQLTCQLHTLEKKQTILLEQLYKINKIQQKGILHIVSVQKSNQILNDKIELVKCPWNHVTEGPSLINVIDNGDY